MTNEVDAFRGGPLTEQEQSELLGKPHSELLAEAFNALVDELETGGNTERFLELIAKYSDRLIWYWKNKLTTYRQASNAGIVQGWQQLTSEEETLEVSQLGVYEEDDEVSLIIRRRTKTEEDEVSVTANLRGEIDEFLRSPKIESRICSDPEEPPDIKYKVTFGSNRFKSGSPFRIVRFEREIDRWDPQHQRNVIYDNREIVCNISNLIEPSEEIPED